MNGEHFRTFLLGKIKETLIEIFNEMSSAMYLYPIDEKSDFKRGAWTPLNVNRDNVVLRYIALAACKSDDIWGYFYSHFQHEVMGGLKSDFELFYQKYTVPAHNLAIFVGARLKMLEAYYNVAYEFDIGTVYTLHSWFLNPVEIAEDDWR